MLIDVGSNPSNLEEKKSGGDIEQGKVISRVGNSSFPSFPPSFSAPHLNVGLPRQLRKVLMYSVF